MKKELEKFVQDVLSDCYAEGYSQEDTEIWVKEREGETPDIGICFEGPQGDLTYPLGLFMMKSGCRVRDIQAFDRYQGGSLLITIRVYKSAIDYELWGTIYVTNDPDNIWWKK